MAPRDDQVDQWRRILIMFGFTSLAISLVFVVVFSRTIHHDNLEIGSNSTSTGRSTDDYFPKSGQITAVDIGTLSCKVFFLVSVIVCLLLDVFLLLLILRKHLELLGIWTFVNGVVVCMFFLMALTSPFLDGLNTFGVVLIIFSSVVRMFAAFCVNELDRLVEV